MLSVIETDGHGSLKPASFRSYVNREKILFSTANSRRGSMSLTYTLRIKTESL